MDHVIAPLDAGHARVVGELASGVANVAGISQLPIDVNPHITLVACGGLSHDALSAAVESVVADMEPITVTAHGYGMFTGPDPLDLSLHVPVVRTRELDTLHRRLCQALHQAGAEIAGWSTPELWLPHITLVDRDLDPARIARATAWLSYRRHPSWRIPMERIALRGGRMDADTDETVIELGDSPATEREDAEGALN